MTTRKILIFYYTLAAFLFCGSLVNGSEPEHYQYESKIDETRLSVDWKLEKGTEYSLTFRTVEELSITIMKPDGETVRWEYQHYEDRTNIIAERQDNCIHVRGTLKGKSIKRDEAVDDAPWYQALSFSLRPFVMSGCQKLMFWTLRPEKMTAHRLIAEKKGTGKITAMNETIPAQEIKITLPGALSSFWSGAYWLDSRNGRFIKYKGATGPPGSPVLTIDICRKM